MKIVYLVQSKFCQRDFDRFGLELLSKRGYGDIEVWDLSAWFRPEYFIQYTPKDLIIGKNYKSIPNKETAITLLKELPENSLFICIFRPNIKSLSIFNYLNKNNMGYGFLYFGHYPSHSVRSRFKQIFNRKMFVLEQLINLVIVRAFNLVYNSIDPMFVILGGGVPSGKYARESTTILKTHSLDYDLFLNAGQCVSPSEEFDNIVFLDDYAPYHPDNVGRCEIDSKLYYEMLNNFFDRVESKTSKKVVIAPHPRSDYEKNGNPFNGRRIGNSPTIHMVKESSLVISHGSTATSFAVLYDKPLLFMENPFYPPYVREFSKTMAAFFNKTPVDISNPNPFPGEMDLSVDKDVYLRYKELYIKESGTPEKLAWDIFADYLDTIK